METFLRGGDIGSAFAYDSNILKNRSSCNVNKMRVDLVFIPVKHDDVMTVPADMKAVRPPTESGGFHDPAVLDKFSFNQLVYQGGDGGFA